MNWNPKKRITALEMLEHPWVRGETASRDKIADSDKKLSTYRVFKSRLEAQVFADIVAWSDKNDESIQAHIFDREVVSQLRPSAQRIHYDQGSSEVNRKRERRRKRIGRRRLDALVVIWIRGFVIRSYEEQILSKGMLIDNDSKKVVHISSCSHSKLLCR